MRTQFGAWRATYTTGDWLALSGPSCMVLMPPAPAAASGRLGDIWTDLLDSKSVTDVAAKIANWGLDELPNLAVFFWDDDYLHCLLRGQVGVVDADSGELLASGVGAKTWFETKLTSRRVYIAVEEVDADTLLQLPMVIGAAQVSSVFLDAMDVEIRFNVAPSVALPTLAEEAAAAQAAAEQAPAVADQTEAAEEADAIDEAKSDLDEDQQSFEDERPQTVVEGNEAASVSAAAMWGSADEAESAMASQPDPGAESNHEESGDESNDEESGEESGHEESSQEEADLAEPGVELVQQATEPVEQATETSEQLDPSEPEEPLDVAPSAQSAPNETADGGAVEAAEMPGEVVEPTESDDQEFAPVVEGNEAASVSVASIWGDGASDAQDLNDPIAALWGNAADEPANAAPEESAVLDGPEQVAASQQHEEAFPGVPQPSDSPAESSEAQWPTPGAHPEPTQVLGDRPPYASGQEPQPESQPVVTAPWATPQAPTPQPRSGGWQGALRPREQQPAAPESAAEAPAEPAPQPTAEPQMISGVPESFRVEAPAADPEHDWRQERPKSRPATIADDHDGETIYATGLAATHKPAEGGRSEDALVLAAMCAFGHPNQPGTQKCRVCGQQVDSHNPQLTSAPVLAVIQTSDGQAFELTRPMILGRAPSRGDRDGDVQLVKVVSPNQDVSRNHLRIAAKGWQIEISDLNSTNGTLVMQPGKDAVELAGSSMPVEVGTRIDLGDGQIVTLASPSGNQPGVY